ncbi:MAG: ATP-dependent DNA ligase [Candidatus Micrarchaeia archaeon]
MEFAELARLFSRIEETRSRLEFTDQLAKLFAEASADEIAKIVYLCCGVLVPQHKGIEIGVGVKLAQQSISLVSGKTVAQVESLYRREGDLGAAAEKLLAQKSQRTLASSALSVAKVYDNFMRIATASGSGSQELKIKLLAELLSSASPLEARYIVRFVQGNLRVGVGESTVLDALSVAKTGSKELRPVLERAFNLTSDIGFVAELFYRKGVEGVRALKPVPFSPIRPALAERLLDAKQIIEKIGRCSVEGKYDGLRLQVHKSGDRVELFSRRQEVMTHMFPDVVEAVRKQVRARQAILEGEAISYDERTGTFKPFQETIQRKRKYGVEEKARELPLRLFAFELLFVDGEDLTGEPYEVRRARLEEIIGSGKVILPAKRVIASTPGELQEFFDEAVASGLEGIVAKDLKAPYTAGARKFAWIKLKKSYEESALSDTLDLVVVGYFLGRGKRAKFGFGGLLAAVFEPRSRSFKTICKIGTGFSEEQMKEFKKILSEIEVKEKPASVDSLVTPSKWVVPKYVVVVKADEITRSPTHTCGMRVEQGKHYGEGLALRFPRFIGMRSDKRPEDATTEEEVLELFELQRQRGASGGR